MSVERGEIDRIVPSWQSASAIWAEAHVSFSTALRRLVHILPFSLSFTFLYTIITPHSLNRAISSASTHHRHSLVYTRAHRKPAVNTTQSPAHIAQRTPPPASRPSLPNPRYNNGRKRLLHLLPPQRQRRRHILPRRPFTDKCTTPPRPSLALLPSLQTLPRHPRHLPYNLPLRRQPIPQLPTPEPEPARITRLPQFKACTAIQRSFWRCECDSDA